jgi:Fe-Mn family superoxide dismutase
MVLYQLPKLSYEYHELEPFIDAETMKIHHTKHHQAYVDGLNTSLSAIGAESHPKYISAILSELTSIPESGRSAINFFGFENFKKIFLEKAISIQGSGWCWLVFNETYHKIEIITTPNQDSPWAIQKTPLLGIDMWEHAYYLKFQNKRPDYVESWWNIVNWDYVNNRFEEIF